MSELNSQTDTDNQARGLTDEQVRLGEATNHWRGFTKYQMPDGRWFATFPCRHQDTPSPVFGPRNSGAELDRDIAAFYSGDYSKAVSA